jgi:NOL1/NOP2/fmu family ribosome biogenesis protein
MGEEKKNRFEPSQALAMALSCNEYDNVLSLSADDERVMRYLKGETIEYSDSENLSKGWVLIAVDNFPLGFGKAAAGQIKNKYLPGWRIC